MNQVSEERPTDEKLREILAPPDVAQWAWDEAQPTDAIINGMCMTWRHDFGLNAPEADADGLGMGMTQAERDGLRMQMRQIWMHDIAPNYARALMAAHAREERGKPTTVAAATC